MALEEVKLINKFTMLIQLINYNKLREDNHQEMLAWTFGQM